jgi:hypothetical protein
MPLPILAMIVLTFSFAPASIAQIFPPVGNAPGVWVEPDGTVKRRQIDEREELASMRARVNATRDAGKTEQLAFVSLPKAFAVTKAAIDAGDPIPDDVKYLGGLTQIRYIFLYPESNDLMIAGPSEPVQVIDEQHAVGKKTGRPVMRLEDLAVAMRVTRDSRHGAFGCRLDPDPAAPGRVKDAMEQMARASRADRVKAVAQAVGLQKVSFFGKVPDDTRFAMVMLAADYELKRYGLGLAHSTVPEMGNIVDNTRAAVNMIWYELAYDPILVSPEGNAYGLRGPRLKVQAGGFDWDPKGATPKAFEFAKKMSKSIEVLAINQPLVADLQNLADLSVVAALIQRDKLDEKVGWNTAWIRGDKESGFPVAKVTVPRNAEGLANYTNGSIAAGGVVLAPAKIVASPTETDEKQVLNPLRQQAAQLRSFKPNATVLFPVDPHRESH